MENQGIFYICEYSFLLLHQNLLSDNYLKLSYGVESGEPCRFVLLH